MKSFVEWSIECQNIHFEALFDLHPAMKAPPPPPPRTPGLSDRLSNFQPSVQDQERDQARSKKRIFQIWAQIAGQKDLTYDMARRKVLDIIHKHPNNYAAALTKIIQDLRVEFPGVYQQISDKGVGPSPAPPPPPVRRAS